jgi:hypothetical protein
VVTVKVEVGDQDRYVVVTHVGEMDIAEMESSGPAVLAAMKADSCEGLLVDVHNAVPKASVMELYGFIDLLVRTLPAGTKIAVIEPPLSEESRFIENAAVNRGLDMRHFHNKADARAWLLAERA